MLEEFKSSLENTYISARENIKNFFLEMRTPIRITKNIIFSALIVYIIFNYSKIIETFIPNVFKFITDHTWESAIALFILLTTKKYLASYAQNFFSALTNKYFMLSLAVLAITGASAALFIPSYTNWFRENDSAKTQQSISTPQSTQSGQDTGNQQKQESKNSASELRGHLLYITGGVIAVLGLIETNRKNSQDHIRQVHATRRERYIEAVDKLSSKEAPVRLGGVYALVGLVDEWLDDDNINRETQNKEGQIIINNLCSYIRSPFSLAVKAKTLEADSEPNNYEGDFFKDQAAFHEEQDVRRAIFVEMSKRSSKIIKRKGKAIKTIPGIWSDFKFDFSRAPIFYLLDELTIEKGNFWRAKFYSGAGFINATFISEADFSGATFTGDVDFIRANFTSNANFFGTTFTCRADFSGATFISEVDFSGATFTQSDPTFTTAATDAEEEWNAQFSAGVNRQDYKFSWLTPGRKTIKLGPATLLDKTFELPPGAVLFDPYSWDEEQQKYTRVSKPAE